MRVSRSGVAYRSSYWDTVRIKGVKVLKSLVLPNFILVFHEEVFQFLDGYLIVAVEVKWFESKGKKLDKKLRKVYREFGQPTRNYILDLT